MAYATRANVLLIVPDLPNTTSANGFSITAKTIDTHITRSDSLVDAAISKRYSIPQSPTPPLLATISDDITAWMTFRSYYTQDNHNTFDHFDEMKEKAFETLSMIREGEIDLFDTAGSLITEKTAELANSIVDSNTIDFQSVFDMDDIFSSKVDTDLLDDIAGKR